MLARRKARFSCLAGALIFAAACATPPALPPVQIQPEMSPATPAAPPPRIVPSPLPPAPAPAPTPTPVPEPVPVPAPPPMAMAAPLPTDAQSLRAAYGTPDFIRREMDTELWRYDGAACAMFFFLYREGNTFKIRYSESLPRGMTMAADPSCVQSLSGRAGAMF